jgi:hypothetical protein
MDIDCSRRNHRITIGQFSRAAHFGILRAHSAPERTDAVGRFGTATANIGTFWRRRGLA